MKKRLIALLLVVATLLSLMGSAAPAVIGEGAVSDAAVDAAVAPVAAADYDYSGDIGKHAVFTDDLGANGGIIWVLEDEPNENSVAGSLNYWVSDFSTDIEFEIIGWKVVSEYADIESQETGETIQVSSLDGLWYCVNLVKGNSTDGTFENGYWIMQNYVSDGDADEYDTLRLFAVCPVCGEENCTTDHSCPICGAENCTTDHSCPICGAEGCTIAQHVTVSGAGIPEGAVFSATEVTDAAELGAVLKGIGSALYTDPEIPEEDRVYELPALYHAIHLAFRQDGVKVQPNGAVEITMPVASLGVEDGQDCIILHLRDDGSLETIVAVAENGQVVFTLDSFSYVLVMNGTTAITDIESFYSGVLLDTNGNPVSTNGHYTFVGIYYKADHTHILIAYDKNTGLNQALNKVADITLEGIEFPKNKLKVEGVDNDFTTLVIKDDKGEVYYTMQNGSYGGVLDIDLGANVTVGEGYKLHMDTAGGWQFSGDMDLTLEYTIAKEVAKGTSADAVFAENVVVDRGDWVIFRIILDNTGSAPLSGMMVQDILPNDVFDMNTVEMSIDGENGAIGNWQAFNSTLFDNYSSEAGFKRILYVRAQVDSELNITTPTSYINTASIIGMNMPMLEDTATITVNPPARGTLTVSKATSSQNPNVSAPDDTFTFTVRSAAEGAGPFTYTKSNGTTGSVANGGTFTLKNGESVKFHDFPVGAFTVTETAVDGYTTRVNGTNGLAYNGEMQNNGAPVVAFENRYDTVFGALNIRKTVVTENAGDQIPDHTFRFELIIGDATDGTVYSYKIGSQIFEFRNTDKYIELKHGQTAVFTDIPEQTNFRVKEVLEGISDDYATPTVNGDSGYEYQGTIPAGGIFVNYVNTYKQQFTDLTITKSGAQAIDENQSFIFDVTGPDGFAMTVVINGNSSVTIKDLPIDEYTVTEKTSWSWRYTPKNAVLTKTLSTDSTQNVFAFENTRSDIFWLSGDSFNENQFTVK